MIGEYFITGLVILIVLVVLVVCFIYLYDLFSSLDAILPYFLLGILITALCVYTGVVASKLGINLQNIVGNIK
jgi:energy-coupling factor transporter transmembrane protein EcfT